MSCGFTQMDVKSSTQNDASAGTPRIKPAVPKKPMLDNDVNRTTHVRDMVRKLQEKETPNQKPNFIKAPSKVIKNPPIQVKEDMGGQTSRQTLEDLKAIDEDLEKLRKQIEERDKIISALREAAEAKDKKLDNLMLEYSKLQSNGKLDLDTSPEPSRATSSSPSSPPLCNGELCWTDSFVNKNYHEPVYAQLLNDHTALQRIYNDLQTKLETKGQELERLKEETVETETRHSDGGSKMEGQENAINLIMAEQIRVLKEREAQLIWEAEELREQNDLMEFRILELEECRKEFLDKEMNEGKHRPEKLVWRERDLEEVSDSGVMSLPTSEDLTSDSELGDAIRNYSPLGAVTNLSLLSESSHSESGLADLKLKKSLKSTECLQESGIFVDSETSSDCAISPSTAAQKHSKACQTESLLDKTLLDIIDSSCNLFLSKNPGYLEHKYLDPKSDDLSTEISKLSVIQKRIQQKTTPPSPKSPVFACPHSNSVVFYEERLSQLEDKLKIYESSGDAKDILLAKRLQKEVELAHRVKELTDKVTTLEITNRRLEEEKCEFEEAENDTRFQCQRLEIRLQELIDKNTELELELERQKIMMSEERRREKKKSHLEGLISRYEQRNFELEEKEIETRQRLSMIEAAMPAIVAWNMFRMVQNPDVLNSLPTPVSTENENKSITYQDPAMYQKLEELIDDQKKLRKDYEKVEESGADREKALREKIEELEAKAAKDRQVLEEMTTSLKTKIEEEDGGSNPIRTDSVDLFEGLKQMITNEFQLRAEIERLEKKEQAYMHSLEKADEIWAGMEADYKKRLHDAETANDELQRRVSQLEATQVELEKALADQPLPDEGAPRTRNEVKAKIDELLIENEKLKSEITRSLNEKFEEHKKFLEAENLLLREELKKMKSDVVKEEEKYRALQKELDGAREELQRERTKTEKLRADMDEKTKTVETRLQSQISDLTLELSQKSKELSSLEVTVAELREEVETLESKVAELVETIQTTIANQEGSKVSPAKSEVSEWSLPVEEPVRHVVSVNLSSSEEMPPLVTGDVLIKKEKTPPRFRILIPSPRQTLQYAVQAVPYHYRQDLQFVLPQTESARKILVKIPQYFPEFFVFLTPKQIPKPSREDEIFQLSLTNTRLQQTLERMEEESRLKDKELEELQRIALEIRKEQEALEALCKSRPLRKEVPSVESIPEELDLTESTEIDGGFMDSKLERLRSVPSIDILQIINPIVVKTSTQVPTSITSLQIALDNLLQKYHEKSFTIKPVLSDFNEKGDSREFEEIVNQLAIEYSSDIEIDRKKLDDHLMKLDKSTLELQTIAEQSKQRPSTPKVLGKSSSAGCSMLLPSAFSSTFSETDSEFSFVAPIKTVRKVGDDSIFLEWDLSRQPRTVTGFEINVNGSLTHRVRSSTRNKALLHPLNLRGEISIQLFAISESGRSTECSSVTYPSEYFLHRRESK